MGIKILLQMAVLVDTYETPAHIIMPELYKCAFCEVELRDLENGVETEQGKRAYVVMKDITEEVLLAVRDKEGLVYVFHREMLTEREYDVLEYYTNEMAMVSGAHLLVTDKRRRRREMYRIEKRRARSENYVCCKLERVEEGQECPKSGKSEEISEYQRKMREGALPFLAVQKEEDVFFPEEEDEP
jgi:hypothetical protein